MGYKPGRLTHSLSMEYTPTYSQTGGHRAQDKNVTIGAVQVEERATATFLSRLASPSLSPVVPGPRTISKYCRSSWSSRSCVTTHKGQMENQMIGKPRAFKTPSNSYALCWTVLTTRPVPSQRKDPYGTKLDLLFTRWLLAGFLPSLVKLARSVLLVEPLEALDPCC